MEGISQSSQSVQDVLRRIESRLVVGFEDLGVDVKRHRVGVRVDLSRKVVYIDSLATTLKAIMTKLPPCSGTYQVVLDEEVVFTIPS